MKKLILLFTIGLFATWAFSQESSNLVSIGENENVSNRDVVDIVCPGPSLYSQLPDGVNAYTATNDRVIFDNILTAPNGPVNSITFWMAEITSYNPLTVDIIFKHDNGSGIPGATFEQYLSVALTETNTGELLLGVYPVLEYTYVFPANITITTGDWVGIETYPTSSNHHYWMTSSDGDGLVINMPDQSVIPIDLSFCLGGTPSIPLSNWALVIGLLLISGFIVVRFRTKMA